MEKMIKGIICDDNLSSANDVKKLINEVMPDTFRIDTVTDETFKMDNSYDVVFLDIEMPTISGFDLAKLIFDKYPETLLVFISTHEELAMEGYKYRVFRFISKEHIGEMLYDVLHDICDYVSKDKEYLILKDRDNDDAIVYIKDVSIIVAEGNYITLYVGKNDYRKRITIKNFLTAYRTHDFILTERGVFVNIKHIEKYNNAKNIITLNNGLSINISRKYKKEFLTMYMKKRVSEHV